MAAQKGGQRRTKKLVTSTVQPDISVAPPQAETGSPAVHAPRPSDTEKTTEAVAAPPDEGARILVDGQQAWATVEVSEDRLQITLTALALEGLVITATELARCVGQAFGLQGRFDGKALRQVIKQAETGVARSPVLIGRGTPAEPGTDGRVELVCVKRGSAEALAQALRTDYAQSLASATVEEVLAAAVSGIAVIPGQVIARLLPETDGTPGKDIYGKPLSMPGQAAVLEAGKHTRLEGDQLVAEIYGYLRRSGESFDIVPPVWINMEATEAYLIHFPELLRNKLYKPEWMMATLAAAGVTHGIDEAGIADLCANWPAASDAGAAFVAAGATAKDGNDTHIDFDRNPAKRAGAVRADGSIDYRERNAATGIASGQRIGKLEPAAQGTPGTTVLGKQLPAKDGKDKKIVAGAHVTARDEDGGTVFYSDIDGTLRIKGDTIEVEETFTVSGDVDFETGNIDVPMNVEIGGSVKSEFEVKSGGTVTIGGVLEPGCKVTAAGDVIIANGVFGDTTQVTAAGDVETKLIQNSTVTLGGDLTVGSYIYNAVVRAGGTITVEEGGSERAGSIIGGEVIAGRQVTAKIIGSKETARTLVGIGSTPQQQQTLSAAEGTLASSHHEIARLMDVLKMGGTTPKDLKARQQRCRTDEERKQVDAQVAQIEGAQRDKVEAQATKTKMETEIQAAIAKGTVRAGTIFSDVYLDFGGQVSRVDKTVMEAEFYLADEGMRWRPT
ncbi:MAG: FapA family protein [bacterium]|nr:FapA family protein [bacterium]